MKQDDRAAGGGPRFHPEARLAMARVLDEALELTVLGSWSRLGIAARRRLWHWSQPVVPASLYGKQVLVTGATSGIGRAAATALVAAGATVGLVGRDLERANAAAQAIGYEADAICSESGGPIGAAWGASSDLSSLDDVTRLAEEVAHKTERLHGLVHGAGLLHRAFHLSSEGTELTVASHVVGPHLLTARLAPLLVAGGPSRVVWVSSGGMYLEELDARQLEMEPYGYRGTTAYARAKRAQVSLSRLWNERLHDVGVASFAMHPGWVDTAGLSNGLPRFSHWLRPFLRTPEQGADTVAWLAGGAGDIRPVSNFWLDRCPRAESRWPGQRPAAEAEELLWAWCEEKTDGAGARALNHLGHAGHLADQRSEQ